MAAVFKCGEQRTESSESGKSRSLPLQLCSACHRRSIDAACTHGYSLCLLVCPVFRHNALAYATFSEGSLVGHQGRNDSVHHLRCLDMASIVSRRGRLATALSIVHHVANRRLPFRLCGEECPS